MNDTGEIINLLPSQVMAFQLLIYFLIFKLQNIHVEILKFILTMHMENKGKERRIHTNLTIYVVCMLCSNKWNIFLIQRITNGFANLPGIFITFLDKNKTKTKQKFWLKIHYYFQRNLTLPFIHTWNITYSH